MADNKLSLIVSFVGQDKLSGALRSIIGLGRTGTQALRPMFAEAKKLKGEMAELDREIAKATGNVTPLINRQRALADAMARVNTQIERQKRINVIDNESARIASRGQALRSQGASNVIGGASLSAPFILAGSAAMDFSSGMVDIQQKAELSNAETAQMARNILAAARAAHQLPENLRGGVDVLAGMGLDPRQAVDMIGPISRLGTAFKVDIADGANAAFSNLNNLKVGLADTGRALDIMAAGGKAGAFEVRDMAQYFPALTASARALGQQGVSAVADLTAALQIARRGTGDSATAANNVQNLLAKINSKSTAQAFQKNFGVDLPNALKRAYAEGKTPLEAIADITKKATGGDLSKLSFAFEDMQAQGALRQLILDMGDYRKIREQISTGAAGTVDAAFRQREAQDASIAWQAFKGSASELAITLGNTVLPAGTRVLGMVNSLMMGVGQWAQANPRLASGLTTLVTALIATRIGFGALQYVLGAALGPFSTLWGVVMKWRALGSLAAVFPQVAQAFGVLRMAALFMARGVMQAGLMLLANPMILAIVAIGAAVALVAYLVYSNWGKIRTAFATGWQWVKDTLSAAPGWLSNLGSMMMSGLLSMIDPFGLRNRLLEVARNGVNAFKAFFGIKSPSRLMMAMGGHMTAGLASGIDQGGRTPLRAMGRMAGAVAGAGALTLAGPSFASPAAAGGAGGARGGAAPITIQIYQQPGEDPQALAERVARLLDRRQGRARRSSYQDDF
ncbi:phage tail tape measure protein [Novosphingobium sp.]|uniref:phage tail tape measure protein n=1 Tax=Novosphingobium sp. TaxID=1874826 RepID=UPI00260CD9B1|nr:phage tail tape measure protein [Novosphingobium sp.]